MTETKQVPASALRFTGAETRLGDNGEQAKTIPVEILARTGQPLNHWFWGNIVHDMSGLRLHKSRLPLDWRHDDNVPMGYVNKFDTASGDLVASGALIPYKDGDKVDEVLHKTKLGLPLEASIDWSAPAVIEEIPEGESVQVNGADFAGPGVVVREWGLRGIALCLYGADPNTESRLSANQEQVTVEVRQFTKERIMSDTPVESVETADTPAVVETPEVPAEQPKTEPAVEAVAVETTPAVETQAEQTAEPAVEAKEDEAQPEQQLAESEPAPAAQESETDKLVAELEKIKAELAEIRQFARGERDPVAFQPPPQERKTLDQMIRVRG